MTIRPIIRFPDPLLRMVAEPVTAFDGALAALASDMLDTMRAAPGLGMTACHIGVLQRVVVIELPDTDVRFYVNPEVAWVSPERARHQEGSVSMPGVGEEVERPAKVRVRYRDLAGDPQTVEADGLLGVCLQHEIDQLDGLFWLRRLSSIRRERVVKRFERVEAASRR